MITVLAGKLTPAASVVVQNNILMFLLRYASSIYPFSSIVIPL